MMQGCFLVSLEALRISKKEIVRSSTFVVPIADRLRCCKNEYKCEEVHTS